MDMSRSAKAATAPAQGKGSKRKGGRKKGVVERRAGTRCVWPSGLEERLDISGTTRWRMEKDGRLPPRDFFIGSKAVGWKPETLEAAEAGQLR